MNQTETVQQSKPSPAGLRGSRVRFTKATERRIFFAMTVIMLAAGILYKTGVW